MSFQGGSKSRPRNLEVPGSKLRIAPERLIDSYALAAISPD